MKFLNPRTDVCFKKMFASEHNIHCTISFLNSILGLEGDRAIVHLTLRETMQPSDRRGGKTIIFDVRCQKPDTEFVMQSLNEYDFFPRAQYYVCREVSSQLNSTEEYRFLRPVVFVGVVDFPLANLHPSGKLESLLPHRVIQRAPVETSSLDEDYITTYSLVNQKNNTLIPRPLIQLTFAELRKFKKKTLQECVTDAERWLCLLREAEGYTEIPKELPKNSVFASAFRAIEDKNLSSKEMEEYILECEGIRKGNANTHFFEEGKAEGELKKSREIARKLLLKGLSPEDVSSLADLSLEDVQKLRE